MKILIQLPRIIATLVIAGLAIAAAWHLWNYYMVAPWTRDGRVRTEIIRLTTDVSGLVSNVHVKDNQQVKKGDLLLTVDEERYKLAVSDAEAKVESYRLTMEQKLRDANRAERLNTAMSQSSREQSIADAEVAKVNWHEAQIQLAKAKLDLSRTRVYAPTDGFITNLSLHLGEYINAGSPLMVLTGSDDYFVTGYFEETKLQRIHIGDKARVTLMGSRTPIYGTVVGFARGIEDQDDANADVNGKLPDVNPTFQWIRLAQRIPVRIELDPLPEQINLVAGQTVTVEVMNTIQK